MMDSESLAGRAAVVTAAGHGIGKAAALRLAEAGATVYATDLDEHSVIELAALHSRIRAQRLDVSSADEIDAVVQSIGAVHVLFNCAGIVHHGSILDCSDDDWQRSFDVNVRAMYRTCRAVLPGMVARGAGVIVNMSSVVSSIKGAQNRFAYGASKAAVIGLTKSIAADFAAHGIRCNALCPGTVDTPSLGERIAASGDEAAARAAFVMRQPMQRLGRPEELADAVLFLASDASSFMTGQTLIVDGGLSL